MKFLPFPESHKIPDGKLRIKFGIDPTMDRLHLGHLVPLRLVKHFKDGGHDIFIIFGTFTAMMGDPSGKEKTRPILTKEEVRKNCKKIEGQVSKFLGTGYNSVNNTFCANVLTLEKFFDLVSKFTLAQLTDRDNFKKRVENNNPIGGHELLVPVMQAWDSFIVKADVEIGGQDQLFNFKFTRKLQEELGQKPQFCMMLPIINGIDGVKMSKTHSNCVYLDDEPEEIFGKCMSISDDTMEEWIPLLIDRELPKEKIDRKKAMAFDIIMQLHGEDKANYALEFFEHTVQLKEAPETIRDVAAGDLVEAVVIIRDASKAEANRLIKGGAVRVDGIKREENINVASGSIIKVGKRFFGRVRNS